MSNIHRWSRADEVWIEQHFGKQTFVEMADHFGVSYTTVRVKALELGLKKAPGYFRYRYVKHYKDVRYKNFKEAV